MNVSDLIAAMMEQKKALETERRNCFYLEKRRQLAMQVYLLGTTTYQLNELLNSGVMEIKMP